MPASVHVDVMTQCDIQMAGIARGSVEPLCSAENVTVLVLPFIAETSYRTTVKKARPPTAVPVNWVLNRARLAAGSGTNIEKAFTVFADSAFWSASFRAFCEHVLPLLPEVAVIVSHGNYLRNKVCTKRQCTHAVPNGGVLRVVSGRHTCFFVRHCVTCHNVDKKGGVWNTVCVNFDALGPARELVGLLKRRSEHGEVAIYSSPLPRAILSAIALQKQVEESERKRFCEVFRSCTKDLSDSSILEHAQRWSCVNPEQAASPFCMSGLQQSYAEQNRHRKKRKRSCSREKIEQLKL